MSCPQAQRIWSRLPGFVVRGNRRPAAKRPPRRQLIGSSPINDRLVGVPTEESLPLGSIIELNRTETG